MVAEIGGVDSNMAKLLADMKNLRAKAINDNVLPGEVSELKAPGNGMPEFSEMLKKAIGQVNDAQQASSSLKKAYELGEPGVDIAQVMIASQKASIAFEGMKQVRNKLIEAYRDVMNMPI